MIFNSRIFHPIGKALDQAETNTTYGYLGVLFETLGPGMGGWIKGQASINDCHEQFVCTVHKFNGNSVVFPGATTVHYRIHDQFVDY